MAGKGTTYVIRPRRQPVGSPAKPKATRAGAKQGAAKSAPPRRVKAKRPVRVPRTPAPSSGRRWQFAVGALILACAAGLWGWRTSEARFERARDRALDYFATKVRQPDPRWMSVFSYLNRRFGVVATVVSGRPVHGADADVRRRDLLEIYRRVDDPMAFVAEHRITELTTPIDRITASALHCDRIGLPADWIDVLRNGSMAGGYSLTRSALATQWTVENGCRSREDVAVLRADQIAWLVTFVNRRHELANQFEAITGMWIEAVAMLHYVGAGDMVQREWIEELVRIQNDDGGWPRNPFELRSDPHATAYALWVVLERLEPDSEPTSWIQQVG